MPQFSVARSTTIEAPPATLHALVDDFHQWQQWSPWEDLDPEMQRSYAGPSKGVGARYEWSGNRKAGQGVMEIVASEPERIEIDLSFHKPFPSDNLIVFRFDPSEVGEGTVVTWTMVGEQKGLMGLVGRIVPMDKMIGPDFERGLGRLKDAAEQE